MKKTPDAQVVLLGLLIGLLSWGGLTIIRSSSAIVQLQAVQVNNDRINEKVDASIPAILVALERIETNQYRIKDSLAQSKEQRESIVHDFDKRLSTLEGRIDKL
jgi:hypothetical protein